MAHQLDSLDKKILRMVAKDARVPFLEVARECNVSGAAIHQRIQKLTSSGVLKGSQEKFDSVVQALLEIPEVVECHYTTGDYDMFIKIYAMNNHHLLNIIHDKLQPLGLSRSETIISFGSAFNRQLPVDDFPQEDE